VTDLPFWLSPAFMSLEGEDIPCHGSAQLARHTRHMMPTIPYVAPATARLQKALADTSLFIALISPSLAPPPARTIMAHITRVSMPLRVPDRRSWQ
jgi:hypothetical protein